MVVEYNVKCDNCFKPCHGDALAANDRYYHKECLNCRACGNDLYQKGFYRHESELYCDEDYYHMFGTKCNGCGKYTEGESVTVGDETYHENCFCCASCRIPFPPGANVIFDGAVYICESCDAHADSNGLLPAKGDNKCAGCGNEIKTGQALLALDKQWHLWCFTCHKCGCLLAGEYMGRDGVPYCEQDYQAEFGVSCAGCGGYITGKVLQAGEKHYHPRCSRCAKCGQMFGEGEEMYLQGSEIWHPHCNDEYQREMEENEQYEYNQQQQQQQNDHQYSTNQYNTTTTTTTYNESKSSENNTPEPTPPQATRPLNGSNVSSSNESRITSAYAAKPFGAQRTAVSPVSMKFANATQQQSRSPQPTIDHKPQTSFDSQQSAKYEITTKSTSYQAAASRDNGSHSGSDDGGPPPPPPPTRSTSHQWQNRYSVGGSGAVLAPKSGQSTVTKTETTVTYRTDGAFNDERVKLANQGKSVSYDKGYEVTKQTNVTTTSYSESKSSEQEVPSFLRRGRSEDSRDNKAYNRRSMPATGQITIEVNSRSTAQDDINVSTRRSASVSSDTANSGPLPVYSYEDIKTTNFKIPKDVDRSRLEEYLDDEEFQKVLKMDRTAFYKLAQWKQKDLKRRAHLF